jgi:hypothetical protein
LLTAARDFRAAVISSSVPVVRTMTRWSAEETLSPRRKLGKSGTAASSALPFDL